MNTNNITATTTTIAAAIADTDGEITARIALAGFPVIADEVLAWRRLAEGLLLTAQCRCGGADVDDYVALRNGSVGTVALAAIGFTDAVDAYDYARTLAEGLAENLADLQSPSALMEAVEAVKLAKGDAWDCW